MIWQSSRNKETQVVSYPNPLKSKQTLASFTSSNLLKQADSISTMHDITSYVWGQ